MSNGPWHAAPANGAEPLISVIMPVYNAARFVSEAIGSVRAQTYTHWELLCCDDGSGDGSGVVLRSAAAMDERIRVLPDAGHQGVARASNRALEASRGEYIARMDADDVAAPERFAREIAYLLEHPSAVAVGGQVTMIDSAGNVIGEKRFPTDPEAIRRMMFTCMPVQQGAMVVDRGRLPRDFVWYRPEAATAEEVELLFRFAQCGQLGNLDETILKYRIHGGNLSLRHVKRTFYRTLRGRLKAVALYGYRPTLAGWLATLAQTVGVTLLPDRWIFPLYTVVRGMRSRRGPSAPHRAHRERPGDEVQEKERQPA